MSVLSLVDLDRELSADTATRKTIRRFVDFVVDSSPLYPLVRARGFDCISAVWLGEGHMPSSAQAVRRLLREVAADATGGRVAVYVCPECGDSGCGAFTLRITMTPGLVKWTHWAYENNYGDGFVAVDELPEATFDRAQYEKTLRSLLDRLTQG